MKTSLDCIPCLLHQSLDAARLVSQNPSVHEQIIRDALSWAGEMDLNQSPPAMAQQIHRRLREITGVTDPYRKTKDWQNRVAMELLPTLRAKVEAAKDPLLMAARLAIAGNVIDMGVDGSLTEADVREALEQALKGPFFAEEDRLREVIAQAKSILYLADNAGEIALDRLLVEQLSPERVTLVVRGSPVLNDATLIDAQTVGLDKIVEVVDFCFNFPISYCAFFTINYFSDIPIFLFSIPSYVFKPPPLICPYFSFLWKPDPMIAPDPTAYSIFNSSTALIKLLWLSPYKLSDTILFILKLLSSSSFIISTANSGFVLYLSPSFNLSFGLNTFDSRGNVTPSQ